jgi:hypothetical protein
LIGNILTLYANFKKSNKKRLLLRTCLISLTISDVVFLLITTATYAAQFLEDISQNWVSFSVNLNTCFYESISTDLWRSTLHSLPLLPNPIGSLEQHHPNRHCVGSIHGRYSNSEGDLGAQASLLQHMCCADLGLGLWSV